MKPQHTYLVALCSAHRLAFVPSRNDKQWFRFDKKGWYAFLKELMTTPRTLISEVACPHCTDEAIVVKGEA